jgi:hypothetical protein
LGVYYEFPYEQTRIHQGLDIDSQKLTASTTSSFQPFERASASYGFLEISLINYEILLYNSRNEEAKIKYISGIPWGDKEI